MTPDATRLFAAIDGTWPAATTVQAGPWTLREGRGGGKRVSAASARDAWRVEDVAAAEKAMLLMSQTPLFMIRPVDTALDVVLEAQGYAAIDRVTMWVCPIDALTDRRLPPVTAFAIWEPLAIMQEIWADGGIDEARQRIMDRVQGHKTGIFGRVSDQPAGAAFCAIHDGIAMVHALEIRPAHRSKGLGGWMMRAAALWAVRKGARWLAVLCLEDNAAANRLYAALNMQVAGQYHYRILPEPEEDDT